MFVFIRTDIPIQHQIVQSNHAVLHMAQILGPEGVPNIVLIGLPDQAALRRAMTKLSAHHIAHYAWIEPDYDFGLTAIATAPIEGAQRAALTNYRVYNWPEVLRTSASKTEGVGENPTGPANGGCADASSARA